MMLRKIFLSIIFLSLITSCARNALKERYEPTRWEKDIRAFENRDRQNPSPKDAVLFVGSSSIVMWRTDKFFGEFDTINRGFGGSFISEVNYYTKRIVLPYKPKVIVFYAGDNDIFVGKSAQQVFDDYKEFVKLVQQNLPETKIIFMSIKPSSSRWFSWNKMQEANKLIEDFSAKDSRLIYFDTSPALLGSDGKPNDALFQKDQLHLNRKGYEAWTKQITPVIKKAMNK